MVIRGYINNRRSNISIRGRVIDVKLDIFLLYFYFWILRGKDLSDLRSLRRLLICYLGEGGVLLDAQLVLLENSLSFVFAFLEGSVAAGFGLGFEGE